jgi:F-box protein 3
VGQEEGLWGALCESRFSLTSPTSPEGTPLPGFKAAFGAWHSAFGRYGQLAARALRAWRLIETWTGEHFPPVAASLRCERNRPAPHAVLLAVLFTWQHIADVVPAACCQLPACLLE